MKYFPLHALMALISWLICSTALAQTSKDISLKLVENQYNKVAANMSSFGTQGARLRQSGGTRCGRVEQEVRFFGPIYCPEDKSILMRDEFFEEENIATGAAVRVVSAELLAEAIHRNRVGLRRFLNFNNRQLNASFDLYYCVAGAYSVQFRDTALRKSALRHVYPKAIKNGRDRYLAIRNFREGLRLGNINKCFNLPKYDFIL